MICRYAIPCFGGYSTDLCIKVECPMGSGDYMNLVAVAEKIQHQNGWGLGALHQMGWSGLVHYIYIYIYITVGILKSIFHVLMGR